MSYKDEFEANMIFTGMSTDIKPIVIYLPQCQTSLEQIEIMRKQCKLAKEHGIYGLAIWCSDKQLMNESVQTLLEHPELDLPFFLILENEKQPHVDMENGDPTKQLCGTEDAVQFISILKRYIEDNRYMQIDGKPVLAVYAPEEILNLRKQISIWRKAARICGIGELYIMICNSGVSAADLEITELVDAECDFSPYLKNCTFDKLQPDGSIAFDYAALVESERLQLPYTDQIDIYRSAMLGLNHSVHRKTGNNCWSNFSFELFYLWLKAEIVYARKYQTPDKRFLFINAWNECGKETSLQQNEKMGYAALNTLSRAIYGLPFKQNESTVNNITPVGTGIPVDKDRNWMLRNMTRAPRIAVQAHVFYEELISAIVQYTNRIPLPFDLYITTNSKKKSETIRSYTDTYSLAEHVYIMAAANKGRDVVPFIEQMHPVIKNYDYLCHLHTKKSNHASMLGDIWRDYLYENLLASTDLISEILDKFESDPKLGIVMPENLDLLEDFINWGGNKELAETMLERLHLQVELPDKVVFPAGDMFWMRTKAVERLFDIAAWEDMIPEENKQTDGTVMHAIERLWVYVAKAGGYHYLITRNVVDNRPMVYPDGRTPVSYTSLTSSQSTAGRKVSTRKKSKHTRLEEAMLTSAANSIGVTAACKAVLAAIVIPLEKKIPAIQEKGLKPVNVHDPVAVARMFGVGGCMTILRKTIGIYLQK